MVIFILVVWVSADQETDFRWNEFKANLKKNYENEFDHLTRLK